MDILIGIGAATFIVIVITMWIYVNIEFRLLPVLFVIYSFAFLLAVVACIAQDMWTALGLVNILYFGTIVICLITKLLFFTKMK